jgi:hypothetical protein
MEQILLPQLNPDEFGEDENLPHRALAIATIMRPDLCGTDYDMDASPHWLVLSRSDAAMVHQMSVIERIDDALEAYEDAVDAAEHAAEELALFGRAAPSAPGIRRSAALALDARQYEPRIVKPYLLDGVYECCVDYTVFLRIFQRRVRRVLRGGARRSPLPPCVALRAT